ncbi:hypothetical protein Ga0074812_11991 [Parafrankia irregularis]|uniref:Uncharacterized protein n=1 Tax=Parafrankia irregularis TaxID=795642 RepID=A0A0S4QTA6_9ACTN|nr:hypothetical protein Ga0074812_11991 [Parafrankia irregularis]
MVMRRKLSGCWYQGRRDTTAGCRTVALDPPSAPREPPTPPGVSTTDRPARPLRGLRPPRTPGKRHGPPGRRRTGPAGHEGPAPRPRPPSTLRHRPAGYTTDHRRRDDGVDRGRRRPSPRGGQGPAIPRHCCLFQPDRRGPAGLPRECQARLSTPVRRPTLARRSEPDHAAAGPRHPHRLAPDGPETKCSRSPTPHGRQPFRQFHPPARSARGLVSSTRGPGGQQLDSSCPGHSRGFPTAHTARRRPVRAYAGPARAVRARRKPSDRSVKSRPTRWGRT